MGLPMTPEARTSPVVALCLVLALAAHATECRKPPNHQMSGCADSCSVFEKNLLTRRARNVRDRLALEETQISLVGQENTDESVAELRDNSRKRRPPLPI